MKTICVLNSVVLILVLTSCGKIGIGTPGSPDPMSNSALSGNVSGASWTPASGEARVNLTDSSKMDVVLWDNSSHQPCSSFASSVYDERQVYLTFTPKTGQTSFTSGTGGFSNAGFVYLNSKGYTALPADSGTINVQVVTPSSLQAGVQIQHNSDTVSGQFTVQFCR